MTEARRPVVAAPASAATAESESFAWRRILLPAFGPTLLFAIGEGAILPVVPLTARELGASVPEAALVVTLIGVGSLVSNIPASLITMHRGERWTIVAAALWCALAMTICATTHRLGLFALGAFMVGMSQSVFSLARQSYLTEAVPAAFRARAMSTLGGVMRIGLFIGPFVAAAAIHAFGLVAAYGVGIVALVGSAGVAARMRDLEPVPMPAAVVAAGDDPAGGGRPSPPKPPSLAAILRDHRRLFVTLGLGVVAVAAVRATRQAVIPLWADHLGLAPSVASLIYGLSGGLDMLVFYPAGKVMDLKGRSWVAVPSMGVMGVALLVVPATTGALALLIAALALGFGNGIGSGMIMTLGADHAPRHGRAHFLGIWRLLSDIGSSLGPALLSGMAAVWSLAAGIGTIGLVAFVAAWQMAHWIPRSRRGIDR